MAAFALVLAVLVATFSRGDAAALNLTGFFKTSSLDCDATGFAPTFSYDPEGETQDFKFDVIIGNETNPSSNCTYTTKSADYVVQNTTFNVTSMDLGPFDRLPYKENGSPICGGDFVHTTENGVEIIEYEVDGKIVLYRRFRGTVVRRVQFEFKIECHMERNVNVSDNDGYNVSSTLRSTGIKDEKKDDYEFLASLDLTDNNFGTALVSKMTYNNDDDIYLRVRQQADQDYFTYIVKSCYATSGSDANPVSSNHKDVFINDNCPVDETTTGQYSSDDLDYQIKTMAFTFLTPKSGEDAIHFHCALKVCLKTDDFTCNQTMVAETCTPTANRMRKRRAISDLDEDVKIVSSSVPVFLKGSEYRSPTCKEGSVFDRALGTCSSKNIMEIRGVRLSNDIYNPDFADTSSVAFKEMAYTKEYQLWVLMKASNNHRVIEGIKIIRARPGSVVLDVLVKYTDSVLPEEAFEVFEKAMSTPASTTRVQDILNIKQGTTQVEFVPIVLGNGKSSEGMDSEKLILIVVLVVLFLVVFVAAAAVFKVRTGRQSTATPSSGSGFDNKGIDA